jgi:hypothetical protein
VEPEIRHLPAANHYRCDGETALAQRGRTFQ